MPSKHELPEDEIAVVYAIVRVLQTASLAPFWASSLLRAVYLVVTGGVTLDRTLALPLAGVFLLTPNTLFLRDGRLSCAVARLVGVLVCMFVWMGVLVAVVRPSIGTSAGFLLVPFGFAGVLVLTSFPALFAIGWIADLEIFRRPEGT